jgi:hypothetical protein
MKPKIDAVKRKQARLHAAEILKQFCTRPSPDEPYGYEPGWSDARVAQITGLSISNVRFTRLILGMKMPTGRAPIRYTAVSDIQPQAKQTRGEIVIEKGVPIPPARFGRPTGPRVPLDKLDVSDSVLLRNRLDLECAKKAAAKLRKEKNWAFLRRKEGDAVRFWRVG